MNSLMWAHPAVQHNIATLKGWGIRMVGPAEGELACGVNGIGRMAEPEEIAETVLSSFHQPLSTQKWLVTAGPTYERWRRRWLMQGPKWSWCRVPPLSPLTTRG